VWPPSAALLVFGCNSYRERQDLTIHPQRSETIWPAPLTLASEQRWQAFLLELLLPPVSALFPLVRQQRKGEKPNDLVLLPFLL